MPEVQAQMDQHRRGAAPELPKMRHVTMEEADVYGHRESADSTALLREMASTAAFRGRAYSGREEGAVGSTVQAVMLVWGVQEMSPSGGKAPVYGKEENDLMSDRFGDLLRKMRRKADKTLGDVALLLGVSVVFISDVERGNRNPFNNDRIIRISEFLNEDPSPLIEAADRERGLIEYSIREARPLEADVVGNLISGLVRGAVTDSQLHRMKLILSEEAKD